VNLPTKFTVFRILITPLFVVSLMLGSPGWDLAALVLFLAGMLSDYIDGRLARSYNQVTGLGQLLDPLADKILISAAFISFVGRGEIALPAWMVIVIVSREFAITGLRLVAAGRGVVLPAGLWGKHKTFSQVVAAGAVLFYLAFHGSSGWIAARLPLVMGLVWICVVLTAVSGLYYFFRHWTLLRPK
jgi:CDP-diacylglycerol--glycerol-3-phosphate 3-phosphatidyltransferase